MSNCRAFSLFQSQCHLYQTVTQQAKNTSLLWVFLQTHISILFWSYSCSRSQYWTSVWQNVIQSAINMNGLSARPATRISNSSCFSTRLTHMRAHEHTQTHTHIPTFQHTLGKSVRKVCLWHTKIHSCLPQISHHFSFVFHFVLISQLITTRLYTERGAGFFRQTNLDAAKKWVVAESWSGLI